jgi:subtilisin family serine protease
LLSVITSGLGSALSALCAAAVSLGPLPPAAQHVEAVPPPAHGYVVRLAAGQDVDAVAARSGVAPTARFHQAVSGFAAPLTAAEADRLRSRPGVLAVEPDIAAPALDDDPASNADRPVGAGPVLHADRALDADPPAPQPPPPSPTPPAPPAVSGNDGPPLAYRQDDPPNWGLDRIDQRSLPLDNAYTTRGTGAGMNIYVIDSGIDVRHPDFGGRAVWEVNFAGGPDTDCDGHGTVVAGIAGSTTFGVAKQATLHSVKVLDCKGAGTLSDLVEGVDWVTSHARRPAVAVLSWRYAETPSDTLTAAVTRLAESGVFVATSAGNTGHNSCDLAPRDSPAALVVANSTIDDERESTSSPGPRDPLHGSRRWLPGVLGHLDVRPVRRRGGRAVQAALRRHLLGRAEGVDHPSSDAQRGAGWLGRRHPQPPALHRPPLTRGTVAPPGLGGPRVGVCEARVRRGMVCAPVGAVNRLGVDVDEGCGR